MRTARFLVTCGLVGFPLLLTPAVAADRAASPSAGVRKAVNRSLPYLQDRGVWWMTQKKCTSCHRVTFMVWSLIEAERRGFTVERKKLDGWIDWALKNPDKNSPDTRAQLILAIDSSARTDARNKRLAELTKELIASRQKDGSWKPGGQLPGQKRPKLETTQVSTIWNTLALLDGESAAAAKAARDKSLKFLSAVKSAKSTEWYAARLLLQKTLKRSDDVRTAKAELLRLQHSDGGWGWLTADKSDALATGISLYALLQTDTPRTDPAVQRAVAFLLKTQQKDGSWAVNGTKANKKTSPQETATYWGTAWATIGLLQTLPVTNRQ